MESRRNGPQLSSRHDDDDDTKHSTSLNKLVCLLYRNQRNVKVIQQPIRGANYRDVISIVTNQRAACSEEKRGFSSAVKLVIILCVISTFFLVKNA